MGEIIRLNLGCGNKHFHGFVNVDFPANYSGKKPDVEADLRALPFDDNYADEAYAIHVIEHFYFWEVVDVLKEWKRVLKPGGLLVLEMPCLEKVVGHFLKPEFDMRTTLWGLYGDPRYKDPNMVHKWAYGLNTIKEPLEAAGFEKITSLVEPQFHRRDRDMRVTASKPHAH